MRGRIWLSLALALLLTGCAETAAEPSAARSIRETEGGELTAIMTEGEARDLTEEEILTAYDRAARAYGWFAQDTLPINDVTAELERGVYRQVNYPGLSDTGDLRGYLRPLFSQEIIDQLMAGGQDFSHYTDVDGALYVLPGGSPKDLYVGEIQTRVERVSETAYSVNVTAELLGADLATVTGMELGAFPYEYQDGRWVFTRFHLMN